MRMAIFAPMLVILFIDVSHDMVKLLKKEQLDGSRGLFLKFGSRQPLQQEGV